MNERTHPGQIVSLQGLLMMALLLCLLLLNLPSTGVIRTPANGGDEDGGSGLGGTGRYSTPGSSGLGGTGYRPFLGFESDSTPNTSSDAATVNGDLKIYHHPTQRQFAVNEVIEGYVIEQYTPKLNVPETPLPAPARLADASGFTKDSSAIAITEQIQREFESNALLFASERGFVSSRPANLNTTNFIAANLNSLPAAETSSETDGIVSYANSSIAAETLQANQPNTNSSTQKPVSWASFSNFLNEQSAPVNDELTLAVLANGSSASDESGSSTTSQDNEHIRLDRPERIQRPELPPVQRVRPVQRAGVLPPRIKPLKL